MLISTKVSDSNGNAHQFLTCGPFNFLFWWWEGSCLLCECCLLFGSYILHHLTVLYATKKQVFFVSFLCFLDHCFLFYVFLIIVIPPWPCMIKRPERKQKHCMYKKCYQRNSQYCFMIDLHSCKLICQLLNLLRIIYRLRGIWYYYHIVTLANLKFTHLMREFVTEIVKEILMKSIFLLYKEYNFVSLVIDGEKSK